jgi:hypothetical protein
MYSIRAGGALCVTLILAGCAAEAPRHQSTTPATPAAPSSSLGGDRDPYLRALYADSRLDPIRDKVPLLLRPDVIRPSYLSNDGKPTPAEKNAITAWLEVRELAQRYRTAHAGEPSQLLSQTRRQVTEAILQLQSGELTYAGFARRVQRIDEDYQAAVRQNLGLRN